MHVIVHVIPVHPNTSDRARALFEEKVPPLAERFSAWRGARLFRTDDNHLVSIGLWADEDQMRTFLAQPEFAQAMSAFSEVFAGSPSTYIAAQLTAVGTGAGVAER